MHAVKNVKKISKNNCVIRDNLYDKKKLTPYVGKKILEHAFRNVGIYYSYSTLIL